MPLARAPCCTQMAMGCSAAFGCGSSPDGMKQAHYGAQDVRTFWALRPLPSIALWIFETPGPPFVKVDYLPSESGTRDG